MNKNSISSLEQLNINCQNSLLENVDIINSIIENYGIKKIEELELGLFKVPDKENLPPEEYKFFKEFGILNKKLTGMISIPLRDRSGRIVNYLFFTPDGKEKKILKNGGVINSKAIQVFKKLILVDNMKDYFSYFQNVKENVIPIIQPDLMISDFFKILENAKVEEIILLNDSPYRELLKAGLKNSDFKVVEISLPDKASITDFLNKSSANRLIAYIETERLKIAEAEQNSLDERLKMIEQTGEILFIGEDREYRVRGFNKDAFEKIVQLAMYVEGEAFPDKVDLSRNRSRVNFAVTAAAEFEMSAEMVREDLKFLYRKLDILQDERFKEKQGSREKNIHIVTAGDAKKAVDLLLSRDLLTEILLKDMEKLGYVEEEINKKLFFLSAISRMTGKPLSILDISPPGTGKSFGMNAIMELMPPDELLMYSRLTPNALYYKREEELQGKVLYIEEISGMEESLEPIRMLLSSGELSVSVVEKDPRTGSMQTVERRVKVDIPILSSGVKDIFDEETLSRFVLTYNDITPKHMERILKSVANKYSLEGEKTTLQKDRVLKKHRDIQKVFDKKLIVVNPFADKIMVNPRLHIVTRKQEQYLRLMYNIAFLRQHSRKKSQEIDRFGNAFSYINVEREDVELANEIALHVFKYSRGNLTRTQDDAYHGVKKLLNKKVKKSKKQIFEIGVSKRELMEEYTWPESTARRYLDELVNHEYLLKQKDGRSRHYIYKLVFSDEKDQDGLNLLNSSALS